MCPLHLVEIKQPTDYESGILPWKYIPNALNKPTTTYQLTQAPHNYLTWVINLRNLKRKKKNKMGFIFDYKKGTESTAKPVSVLTVPYFCFPAFVFQTASATSSTSSDDHCKHTHAHKSHQNSQLSKTLTALQQTWTELSKAQWVPSNRHGQNCPKHSECLATDMDGTVQSTVSA